MTIDSPVHSIAAPAFLKSKRWESSLAVWFSALSTSWRSTLLTMSNEESATAIVLRSGRGGVSPAGIGSVILPPRPHAAYGRLPERPMGADCKSVG